MARRVIEPNFKFGVVQDVRPAYGAGEYLFISQTPPANTDTLLGTVLGKGVTYGGFAYVNGLGNSQSDGSLTIYLDDVTMGKISFVALNTHMIDKPEMHSVWKRSYDDAGYIYILGIKPGMTFEKSLKIYYDENNGFVPHVVAGLIYALV